MSQFQQIFDEADEISGLGRSASLPQRDMSQFEAMYKQEETRKQLLRNQVVVSDLERLRSMIQKISIPREEADKYAFDESDPNQVVLGTYTKKLSFPQSKVQALLLQQASAKQPYYNWEEEVHQSMKVDDSCSSSEEENLNHKKKPQNVSRNGIPLPANSRLATEKVFQRIHKFDVEIAPYRCFDTEYIDVDEVKDPLDKIFPNYKSSAFVYSESEGEDEKKSIKAGEAPTLPAKREGLFKRFTKAEEQNVEGAVNTDNLFFSPDDEARQQKILRDKQRLEEKIQRIKGVSTWLDTSSSLIKNAPKRTRDVALHSRVPAMIAQFNHSNIALSHFNTRCDLKEIELKYFHRPRMLKERDRPWQISLKQKTSMNRKLKGGQNELGKIVLAEEDKQNLSLMYKDNTFILVEYIEEFPPVMMNYGMASCIINYFRSSNETAQELDEANEANPKANSSSNSSSLVANLHKRKMARTSSKNESALEAIKKQLQDSDCRLPRHVLLLWELNNTKRSYEHDANVPRQKIGSTKVLSPEDASPFLGNIEVGELQKSFENNLFRSPLFEHPVSPTDFLLIRTKMSNSQLSFSIREIPHIFLSGQLEPQVVVPRPSHKYSAVLEKFYLLTIVRALQSHVNGMNYQEIFDTVLKYSSKEVLAPHRYFLRQHFRDLLKKVADEVRESGSFASSNTLSRWFAKEFSDPELENTYSADTLAKNFLPEDICIQESSNAAEYRLLQSNITDVELMKVQVYLHFLHSNKQYQRERLENLNDFATELSNKLSYGSSSGLSKDQIQKMMQSAEKLKKIFIQEIHRTDVKQSIARFILERLITAPWNTTEAFVNSVIKGDSNGKMNVRGKGDPSGIGEAFAYVRLPNVQLTMLTADALKKKKEEDKEKNKLVGTDKDLRSLTKSEAIALLVRFKVDKEEAKRLSRWDRIHMIRSFVNELARKGALNEDEKGLIKFARDPALMNKLRKGGADAAGGGSGVGGLDIAGEEFKKICDEIWNRQKLALSERVPPSQQRIHQTMVTSPAHRATRENKQREKKMRRQESALGSPRGSLKRSRSQEEDEMEVDHSEEDSDSDEDSDESDLAEDIEKALSSRSRISNRLEATKSQSVRQHEQDKLEYQSFNSVLSSGHDAVNNLAINIPNKEKKKKILIGISGGNKEGATPRTPVVSTDSTKEPEAGVSTPAPSTTSAGSVAANLSALAQLSNQMNSSSREPDMIYPTRVVKRVTRITQVDGEEVIKVEFIFAETEVQRIQAIAEKAKRDRMERRTMTALSHHPYCNKMRGSDGNYLDSDDEYLATNPTMSLQVGKIRQTVDHHHQIQTIQANMPLSKKEKQLTIKTQKGRQHQNKDEELEFISKVKSTKRSSVPQYYTNSRLPRVTFAVRLEKEIMTIWTKPEAELFRYPVDRNLYPMYYTVVAQPICLADIREKVARYQYETLEQFLADLKLMADNSEKFNGRISPITDMARKIYQDLKLNIDHEKQRIQHPQVDFFTKTEEMMRQKKAYYRRGLHDLAGVGGNGGGGGVNSSSSSGYIVNSNVIGGGLSHR